jgi:hypothetical protein
MPGKPPAELDAATRELLANAIARVITAKLGSVRISSIPPSETEPPRSSMRVAAAETGRVGKWLGRWGLTSAGAVAGLGQIIVWTMKPEYAGPLSQAAKLIFSVIIAAMAAAGGNSPADATPPTDVPAIVLPALAADAGP